MGYYNTFQKKKRIKIWGHRTYYLSRRPNLSPPQKVSFVNQYKKFRNYHFSRFYDAILLVNEQISIKMVKKKKEGKTLKICADSGIDPGPLAL